VGVAASGEAVDGASMAGRVDGDVDIVELLRCRWDQEARRSLIVYKLDATRSFPDHPLARLMNRRPRRIALRDPGGFCVGNGILCSAKGPLSEVRVEELREYQCAR
jgi:hypothetical protein